MSMSPKGIAFLKKREAQVSSMYNDTAGNCTVGVGHLVHKGNCDIPALAKLNSNFDPTHPFPILSQQSIAHINKELPFRHPLSANEINAYLEVDVKKFEELVNGKVKVDLSQNQFDALVSFSFNIGPKSLATSSLLKLLNNAKFKLIAGEMLKWCKESKNGKHLVNAGLLNRRKLEADLFDRGIY